MSIVKLWKNGFPLLDDGNSNWWDINDFFADDFFARRNDFPAMNIKENETNFEIELAVPGFSKNEIQVSLENDILHISAEKSVENKEEEGDYTRREFNYNSFDRKLQIPKNVSQDQKIDANYKNGVLKLQLNKMKSSKGKPRKLIKID